MPNQRRSATRSSPAPAFAALLFAALLLAGCASTTIRRPVAAVPDGTSAPTGALAGNSAMDAARPPADADGYRPPLHLAVLLPLSGSLATAAVPVRDGLLAGYYAESRRRPDISFHDTAGGVAAAYDRAVAAGADF